jgi:hypothetical protein
MAKSEKKRKTEGWKRILIQSPNVRITELQNDGTRRGCKGEAVGWRGQIKEILRGRFTSPRHVFSEGQINNRMIADYKGSIARTILNKLPRAALQILRLRCDIYICPANNLSRHSNLSRMAGWCEAHSSEGDKMTEWKTERMTEQRSDRRQEE